MRPYGKTVGWGHLVDVYCRLQSARGGHGREYLTLGYFDATVFSKRLGHWEVVFSVPFYPDRKTIAWGWRDEIGLLWSTAGSTSQQ